MPQGGLCIPPARPAVMISHLPERGAYDELRPLRFGLHLSGGSILCAILALAEATAAGSSSCSSLSGAAAAAIPAGAAAAAAVTAAAAATAEAAVAATAAATITAAAPPPPAADPRFAEDQAFPGVSAARRFGSFRRQSQSENAPPAVRGNARRSGSLGDACLPMT